MRRLIAVLPESVVDDVVDALVRHDVHGVTLESTTTENVGPEAGDESAGSWVRLEVVVESHRADEVIESVEAILDSMPTRGPAHGLVVENVEAVVYIRSGRILT